MSKKFPSNTFLMTRTRHLKFAGRLVRKGDLGRPNLLWESISPQEKELVVRPSFERQIYA